MAGLMNTVFQSGAPMGVPSSVYVIGDPHLENPTWDRLFKTGYIDVNGAVRNVLPGEQPVFVVRPPNTLRSRTGWFMVSLRVIAFPGRYLTKRLACKRGKDLARRTGVRRARLSSPGKAFSSQPREALPRR